jgi:hypothetical protein
MSDTFTAEDVGRTFYSANGDRLHLEAITATGTYVVTRSIEIDSNDGYGGYEYHDDMFITDKLYRKPPIAKKAEELEHLQKQIKDAKAELSKVKTEITLERKSAEDLLTKVKAYPALRFVLDYLEGDVLDRPCVMELIGDWKIMPLREALGYKDEYDYRHTDKLRLLSLYGNSKGDLRWNISRYCDGSGNTTTLYVAENHADAENFVSTRVRDEVAHAIKNRRMSYAAQLDTKYPGRITAEQRETLENHRVDSLRGQLVKKAEELRKVEGELNAIKTELQAKKGEDDGTTGNDGG